MAVIGKIQKNSVLLLIVIGLAMLAFIFTDFFKGGSDVGERLDTATLYGEPIDEVEYQNLRDAFIDREQNNYNYQQKAWTKEAERDAENQAFNEIVRRTLMNNEFEKLGISCTTNELNDMIHGKHIHPWVLQIPIFNGASGFSRDSVRSFINSLEVEPQTEQERANWLTARKQWKDFEKELKNARNADKYITLVRKGMYVNALEAADKYNGLYGSKKIRFVVQPFASISPDEIEISDAEIKAYFEKHKNEKKYAQKEAREIQMVSFPIFPTKQDIEFVREGLSDLKKDFKAVENNIGFVNQNSESQFLSDTSTFKYGTDENVIYGVQGATYPRSLDDKIQNSEVGDVFGPFESVSLQQSNNSNRTPELAIVKVTGLELEKQAWVRHILISSGPSRTEEAAKIIADSIINVIKDKNNFVEMVKEVSEDPGSIKTNGEYKWFAEGVMVAPFNDASFNGPIGKIQLVKTDYGYHIVEVLGRAERKVPTLAVVTHQVQASEATIKDIESRVYEYIYTVSGSDSDSAFYKIAADSNLTVQTTKVDLENDMVIGFSNPERLLKFAFNKNAAEGDYSDPMLDGNNYIFAMISNVIEEGTPKLSDVQGIMKFPALKEKQGKVYAEKMSNKKSLEDVAAAIADGVVRTAEIKFDEGTIQQGGQKENYLIGTLFTNIPAGSMTKPIIGEQGVFVVIVDSELTAPETTDYSNTKNQMRVVRLEATDNLVIQSLREKAKLVDNRKRILYK